MTEKIYSIFHVLTKLILSLTSSSWIYITFFGLLEFIYNKNIYLSELVVEMDVVFQQSVCLTSSMCTEHDILPLKTD